METDFLESFSSYDETENPRAKTPAERAEANHEMHKSMDPSTWGVEIMKTFKLRPVNLVALITRINVPDICTVFVFSEQTEIITSNVVRNVIKSQPIYLANLSNEQYKVATLSEVVHYPLMSDQPYAIIYSRSFRPPPRGAIPILLLQYTTNSSICMKSTNIFEILDRQATVVSADFNDRSLSLPESTSTSDLTVIPTTQNIHSLYVSLSRRLDETNDYLVSLARAYERCRRICKATFDITRNDKERANDKFDEVKGRIGHLHEEVMRHAISVAYGYDWGTPASIGGFSDAVSFVSIGLSKSPAAQNKGKTFLMKRFCKDLHDFEFGFPEHFKGFTVDQSTWKNQYSNVSSKISIPN